MAAGESVQAGVGGLDSLDADTTAGSIEIQAGTAAVDGTEGTVFAHPSFDGEFTSHPSATGVSIHIGPRSLDQINRQ